MGEIDSKLTKDDVDHLLALRAAMVRHAPSPAVPTGIALCLGGFGYTNAASTGGLEITESGIAFLEQYFLFCQARGCDGILRRWAFLSPVHSACDPDDPDIQPNKAGGYYIKCAKCGSANLLEGNEMPTRLGHFRVQSVIAGELLR